MIREVIGKGNKLLNVQTLTGEKSDTKPDDYLSRLLKLIPAEVIALYTGIYNVLKTMKMEKVEIAYSIIAVLMVICCVVFLLYTIADNTNKWKQLIISTISLIIWMILSGGIDVFFSNNIENATGITTIVMMLWIFIIPIFYKGDMTDIPPTT